MKTWRYYLSPEATRVMHRDHYLSVPHLAREEAHRPLGSLPGLTDTAFWVQRFGRLAEEPAPEVGSCIAFTCTRRADSPVE